MIDRDPAERSAQAAEYVLGTLTAEERREFEAASAADPALRAEQQAWEQRLAGLGLKLPPVAPRPIVWLDVLQKISGSAAGAVAPAARGTRITRVWAALATAASLVLGFGLYREMNQPPPAPRVERVEVPVPAQTFVAVLQVPRSTMHWTISVVPGRNEIAVRAGGEAPAAARELDTELWLIGDAGPVSLGLIPKSGEVRRALPANLAFASGGTVAVSLEPRGGSPTGQPTGPVVTTATLLSTT
jgi:anti-sigma-K factor RskA